MAQALDNAGLVKNEWADIAQITLGYGECKKAEEICLKAGGQNVEINYDKDVTLTVALPSNTSKETLEKIIDLTQGKAKINLISSGYFQFEI